MKKEQGFASVMIVVVILAVIAVGGYLLVRTPAPVVDNILPSPARTIEPNVIATADKTTPTTVTTPVVSTAAPTSSIPLGWKTYRDPVYKYEFSYPSNWKFGSYGEQLPGIIGGVAVDPVAVWTEKMASTLDGNYGGFWIRYLELPDDTIPNFDSLSTVAVGPNNIQARYKKGIIGADGPNPSLVNHTFLLYYLPLGGEWDPNGNNGIGNNAIMEIQISYLNNTSAKDKAIYDQILSTFKFTK